MVTAHREYGFGVRRGSFHPRSRFTEEEVDLIRDMYFLHGYTVSKIADFFESPHTTIYNIVSFHNYAWRTWPRTYKDYLELISRSTTIDDETRKAIEQSVRFIDKSK